MKGMGGNRKLNKQMRKMMKDGEMDLDPSSFGMWFVDQCVEFSTLQGQISNIFSKHSLLCWKNSCSYTSRSFFPTWTEMLLNRKWKSPSWVQLDRSWACLHYQRFCLHSQQQCSYHSCLLQLCVESLDCSCMHRNQPRQTRPCSTPQQHSQSGTEAAGYVFKATKLVNG